MIIYIKRQIWTIKLRNSWPRRKHSRKGLKNLRRISKILMKCIIFRKALLMLKVFREQILTLESSGITVALKERRLNLIMITLPSWSNSKSIYTNFTKPFRTSNLSIRKSSPRNNHIKSSCLSQNNNKLRWLNKSRITSTTWLLSLKSVLSTKALHLTTQD